MRSTEMGYKAAQSQYYAIGELSNRIGLPLNQWITINFAQTGIDPRKAVSAFAKLRNNHTNKWLTRPRKGEGPACTPTFTYAFENAREDAQGNVVAYQEVHPDRPHNVHVHWLIHIPPARLHAFKNELWGWVETVAGPLEPNAVHMMEIMDERGGLRGAREYFLKGAPSASRFSADHKPQGLIVGGRRSNTSRNLGPMARRALDRKLGIKRRSIPSSAFQVSISP